MIHIEGHTMFGYGYEDPNVVLVYDTWNPNGQNPGTMTWGGSYGGAPHLSVTALEITGGDVIPEPSSVIVWSVLGLGIVVVGYRRRKRA